MIVPISLLSATVLIACVDFVFALPAPGPAGGILASLNMARQPSQCPVGFGVCDVMCVDFSADPENCGGCGLVCESSAVCMDGTCALPPSPPPETLNGLIKINAYEPCYLSISTSGPECGSEESATTFTIVYSNPGIQSIQVAGEDSYIQVYLYPGQSVLDENSNNVASLSLTSSPSSPSATNPTLGAGVYYETAVFSIDPTSSVISGTWVQDGTEYSVTWLQNMGQGLLATASYANLRSPTLGLVTLSFVPL